MPRPQLHKRISLYHQKQFCAPIMSSVSSKKIAARQSFLQPAWNKSSSSEARFKKLVPYIKGKSVLDIGCTQGKHKKNWLHKRIRETASYTVGLDLHEQRIRELRKDGYEIVYGDAQDLDLGETFDVVFAGELIEHLDNFRGFFDSIKRHLNDDGTLIITTPNALLFTNVIYNTFGEARVNREHTCRFCKKTLTQLLDRMGFDVVEFDYIPHKTPGAVRKVISKAARVVLPDRVSWGTLWAVTRQKKGEVAA